jgi:glycosyltransferase involved in cell wall biosynthesis
MAGLKQAQGEFVGFVDADDWVDPRMYEELYRAAVLHSAEVAQCGFLEVFEDSGKTIKHSTKWGGDGSFGLSGLSQNPRTFLATKPTVWRRIYLRKFLLGYEIAFPEHVRRFDDLPFQFEVLVRAKRMAVIPDCYYSYRLERDGQDVGIADRRLFVHFAIFDWLANNVLTWADAEIEQYFARCEINTHLWALGRIKPELRWSYMRQAAFQFVNEKRHLRAREFLRIGASLGPSALTFVMKSLLITLFGPSKKPDDGSLSRAKPSDIRAESSHI